MDAALRPPGRVQPVDRIGRSRSQGVEMIDARGKVATALALVAIAVAAPAASAATAGAPARPPSSAPTVDARHHALITRHEAAGRRASDARDPSPRAAAPAIPRSVPSGDGGWSWDDPLLAVGTVLGAGLLAGIAGLGVVRRRERMGHPVN
jgi:hypothetical protein